MSASKIDISAAGHPGGLPAMSGDQWIEPLQDGSHVFIRPLRAEDRTLESNFLKGLSPRALRDRFQCEFREPTEALLDQLMAVDGKRSLALIALIQEAGEFKEVGVARYVGTDIARQCECAVVVADAWQSRGLALVLMHHLIEQARRHGLRRMVSLDAVANESMRDLARQLGFHRALDPTDATQVIHTFDL